MEWLILGTFSVVLLGCVFLDIPILYALFVGLCLFIFYGSRKGFSLKELFRMGMKGVYAARNILTVFFLIGILTAFWRASGTVALIVCISSSLIRPSIFLLLTFLMNAAVSVLTGTSFGTSATMGVIFAMIGRSMGIDPCWTGGAVLSGVFFGDRCSPVSTSALLVADVTETDIYDNIHGMVRTAAVPFGAACLVFLALGLLGSHGGSVQSLWSMFIRHFDLQPICLIPAVAVLLLAAFRVNVRIVMAISILLSGILCLFWQLLPVGEIIRIAIWGYHPSDPEIAAMLSGGGVLSMLRVAGIVCLSSSYSVIFEKTGLLLGIKKSLSSLSRKTSPFTASALTALLTGMVACNQTLAILLTEQLCGDLFPEKEEAALALEDTAVVIPALIPWCIAGSVPLATIGAPAGSYLFACYLYLLPVWGVLRSLKKKRQEPETPGRVCGIP